MGFWLNRIRQRQGAVLHAVAAATVLAAAACGRTDAVPAETAAEALLEVPEDARVAAPVDLEEPPAAPEPPETIDSWCVDGSEESFGFRLENGKTVSICVAAGSPDLTYTYGVLGQKPELVYSGPLLGTFEDLSGYSDAITDLADGFATEFSGPDVSVSASGEALAAAASAPDSRGFFYVHSMGCCGGEENAYLFKRGGWEYAVSSGSSRNVNPDIAAELGDYSVWQVITVTSPDGERFTIR